MASRSELANGPLPWGGPRSYATPGHLCPPAGLTSHTDSRGVLSVPSWISSLPPSRCIKCGVCRPPEASWPSSTTCSQPPQEFIPTRYSLGRSRPGKALRKVLLFCKSSQKGFSEEVIFELDFEEWVGVSGEKATTIGEIGEEEKLKRALNVWE